MTCNGDNKECPNEVKWQHPVIWHGVQLGIYYSCEAHRHCKDCAPVSTIELDKAAKQA